MATNSDHVITSFRASIDKTFVRWNMLVLLSVQIHIIHSDVDVSVLYGCDSVFTWYENVALLKRGEPRVLRGTETETAGTLAGAPGTLAGTVETADFSELPSSSSPPSS